MLRYLFICAAVFSLFLQGCAGAITHRMGASLSAAIADQDDPDTVRAGSPAYLLLMDGLIKDEPEDQTLLIAGAKLYSAYATVFVEDPQRARRLADKGRDYGRRALCLDAPVFCESDINDHDAFLAALNKLDQDELPSLYSYATSWAAWVKARSAEPLALADVPKIEAMLARVVALDEAYERGEAQLYLGILRSQIPPALGGRPELGQAHFEKAIALSEGNNLFAKVEYAHYYARLMFERELHDSLLKDVLAADPVAPGYTLGNVLAQQQARVLLDGSADYFGE